MDFTFHYVAPAGRMYQKIEADTYEEARDRFWSEHDRDICWVVSVDARADCGETGGDLPSSGRGCGRGEYTAREG